MELQPSKPSDTAKKPADKRPDELTLTQSVLDIKAPQKKGPRFTLSARDADVKTVLLAIAKEIDQNIIIDPSIRELVTVDLKEVTLIQALDSILEPLRLKYSFKKEFIRITPEKMKTRIFQLNYIISRRAGSSNLQSSSGGSGRTQATSGAGSAAAAGITSGGGTGRSTSSIFSSEETDLWTEITTGLQQIISGGGTAAAAVSGAVPPTAAAAQGSTAPALPVSAPPIAGGATGTRERAYVTVNRQAGIIILKDYPDVLLQAANFLEAIEGSVQRQVFITAKILEVTLSDGYELGIDWSRVSPFNVVSAGAEGLGGGLLTSLGQAVIAGDGLIRGDIRGGFVFNGPTAAMDLVIDALSQQGDVSVLSSPKIATLNNQRAVIKVGKEDIFFTTDISRGTQGQNDIITFTPSSITIGIILDVLPQINENGSIMMSINASITEEIGRRETPGGTGGTTVPILDVRETNSVVIAQSGQTIIIGGLMKTKKQKKFNSVPLLGDIPLIGVLFQHEEEIEEKVELVIMLTPEVMVGQGIDDKLQATHRDFRRMNSGVFDMPSSFPELSAVPR
ncbi:MAG: secretin N-terminal domain-containing protein [Nitrospinaceae bacterium]